MAFVADLSPCSFIRGAIKFPSTATKTSSSVFRYSKACSTNIRAMATGASTSIKVVVNGAGTSLGRAAIRAISAARGMEVAAAVDSSATLAGQDAGEMAGLEEPLEVPVVSDLLLVLGSLAQTSGPAVVADLRPTADDAYENVRQATAFGLRSVVGEATLPPDYLQKLSVFCDKASMGCVVAPSLSVGASLLQQSAASAAFFYSTVDLVEYRSPEHHPHPPSPAALAVAEALAGLGRRFKDDGKAAEVGAQVVELEEGVRWQGLPHPCPGVTSLEVVFRATGQRLRLCHEVENEEALMPGLLLALRRVTRLKVRENERGEVGWRLTMAVGVEGPELGVRPA